ncbi:MAG TPA: SDR family oxidoreductase [Gaiellales bacterium]|nr:SDR family oxidoreductase [Gaiellales bacterium]
MSWLEGRTAVVTGGAGGIGSEICQELAAEGAAVAIWDLDGDRAEALAAGIPRATAHRVDITDSADVDRVTAKVRDRHGTIDTLINNAGISKVGDHTHELSDEIWNESIAVMQTGVFFCSRAVGRVMIDQGKGTVVNISSIRGYSANPGRLGYCAAKAAVIIMTEVMAGEWGPLGIRVNAIAPGVVATGMWKEEVARGLYREEDYIETIPSRRLAEPSEIGRLCAFLSSDECAYINGACITIDGALTRIPSG